jgi:leucyl aminopeptidase
MHCFTSSDHRAHTLLVFNPETFVAWREKQESSLKEWLSAQSGKMLLQQICLLPTDKKNGKQLTYIYQTSYADDLFLLGDVANRLPAGNYVLANAGANKVMWALGFALGAYRFSRYKKSAQKAVKLVLSASEQSEIKPLIEAIYWARDLINLPANDLGPLELAHEAKKLVKSFGAKLNLIAGKDLLKQHYPAIYGVGAASHRPPHLIDLTWGKKTDPYLTLVGKGVCFDTGGLNIKVGNGMLLMKKDMGGAAHVLALAHLVMQAKLPVRLRVLIPAVDNVISGEAYRPGDVLQTRAGLTVEVADTDAEGRLVLADALTEAVSENPDLLIDFATLTGAARIAVGAEIAAFFTPDDKLAVALEQEGVRHNDPVCRLPLHQDYRTYLDSPIADLVNVANHSYGGAIVAALFLKEFVGKQNAWMHIDLMAWNLRQRPGRPQGGEAMALRAVWALLQKRYVSVVKNRRKKNLK